MTSTDDEYLGDEEEVRENLRKEVRAKVCRCWEAEVLGTEEHHGPVMTGASEGPVGRERCRAGVCQ